MKKCLDYRNLGVFVKRILLHSPKGLKVSRSKFIQCGTAGRYYEGKVSVFFSTYEHSNPRVENITLTQVILYLSCFLSIKMQNHQHHEESLLESHHETTPMGLHDSIEDAGRSFYEIQSVVKAIALPVTVVAYLAILSYCLLSKSNLGIIIIMGSVLLTSIWECWKSFRRTLRRMRASTAEDEWDLEVQRWEGEEDHTEPSL